MSKFHSISGIIELPATNRAYAAPTGRVALQRAASDPYFWTRVILQNVADGSNYWFGNADDHSEVWGTGSQSGTGNIDTANVPSTAKGYDEDFLTVQVYARKYGLLPFAIQALLSRNQATAYCSQLTDTFITEATEATVAAYTGISINHATQTVTITENHTPDELYDYAHLDIAQEANMLYDNWFSTSNGTDFTSSYNITVNNCALSGGGSINLGSKTLTLSGTGSYDGSYIDADGIHAPLSAPNIDAGARIRIKNKTKGIETVNTVLSGAGYSERIVIGAGDYDIGDEIELAAAYQNGTTAKLLGPVTGTMTATGLTFTGSMATLAEYPVWNVDGSTVAEYGIHSGVLWIDIDDPDGYTTYANLFAWFFYYLTTEDGIRNLFGGLRVLNAANVVVDVDVVDILFFNVNSTPVTFTDNARITRSDGSHKTSATTVGTIEFDPGEVYLTSAPAPTTAEIVNAMDSDSKKFKILVGKK